MAKVTPVGRPANEAERDVIFYLQNNLPDSFEIYHNLELRQGKQVYEIDLIIIGPRCVFVVDVKATHGKIEVFGSKWHPEGRSPFHSPVVLVRQHAKVLATQIGDANRARPELRNVHVQATVLLTADDAFVIDHTGKDEPHITYADQRCLDYFQGHDFIPPKRLSDIRKYGGTVRKAIEDKSAPSTGLPRYRDWQVIEKLGRSPDYIEYRAHKIDLANDIVRLKVYQVNPYAPSEERQEIRNLISTAYQALRQISFHSNIEQVIDFFNTEDEDAYVLVTADLQGKSLRQYIEQGLSSLEKTWKIFQEVLSALDHAHQSGIIHRNITPDSIFIDDQTKTYLIGFDYARISGRTSTIANDITETLADDLAYQAPECHNQPSAATHQSDLFSAGLVFYELLTGQSAFQDASDLCDRSAIFPQKPSQLNPKLLLGLDQWLQKLCAFNPAIRYESADDALGKLAQIIREPSTQVDSLPEGTILDERYEVLDNLGQPGNFGIVYRVADTWEGETRVLKLIIHDHYSTHNRLLQEYLSLKPVPKHPYIVDAVWAGELKNGIPFILFEYVEGRNLEEVIKAQDLSEIKAEAIIQAILEGLQHLHQHGVYHQDIKPSNILLTEQGIKIIDFNVAVTDKEPDAPSAGTPRYIPPDLAHQQQLNQSERIDRDLYGAGLVFYECLTGCYPFQSDRPPLSQPAPDPLTIEGCHSLSPHWSSVLAKAIAPLRCDRFSTVDEFLAALTPIHLPQIAPPHPLESIQSKDSSNTSEIDAQAIDSPPLHLDETESIPALPQPVTALIQVISSDVAKDEVTDVETERPLIDSAVDYAKSETVPAVRQPSREQPIVLDPTKAYPALPSYVPITTEVEWLQKFGTSDSPYWVRGKRLCQWARDWLSAWNKLDLIEEEKTDPRISLEQYLGTSKAISSLDNSTILNLLMHLESQADDQPIAALLARETQSDRQFWLSEPSIDHLARWLSIQVPSKFSIIEHAWCQQLPRTELAEFYQPSHKLDILRQWLGLHEPRLALEKYPLSVPAVLQEEFEQFWQRRLYLSEAKDINTLDFSQVANSGRVAELAYQMLIQNPKWITRDRTECLSIYLKPEQELELNQYQSPLKPQPLDIETNPEGALQWVTDQYLPFRQWEIVAQSAPTNERESDRLADSFVNWILEHYPNVKEDSVLESHLNYKVGAEVQARAKHHPVLWVVVDGLGWLDHKELLAYLTDDNSLNIVREAQPLFSILPTKTEYAKWSLYSQCLPRCAPPNPTAGQGFKFENAKRYTDNQIDQLYKDLRRKTYPFYCWDTTELDELFHHHTDWQSLYRRERPRVLENIAKRIHNCLDEYPEPNALQIVIASDHGQLIGVSAQMTNPPNNLTLQGRMAGGTTDDERFVVLDCDRYAIPEPISIVRGAESLTAYSYTTNQEIIGSHGGLFPEEVVVGYSVLCRQVSRSPVWVCLSGDINIGNPGHLSLTIRNTNPVSLTNLQLWVEEIPALQGILLSHPCTSIEPQEPIPIPVPADIQLPTTMHNNRQQVPLSGYVTFQYAGTSESEKVSLDPKSSITVRQMFSSGLEGGIDEFL